MNYFKIYYQMIKKAMLREKPDEYCEKHHTFPQSIFGPNDKTVFLTAKEHFIAHFILWKLYKKRYGEFDWRTKKMGFAFNQMSWSGPNHRRHCSRSFVYARNYSSLMNSGDRNPAKRPEIRKKISENKTGRARKDLLGKRYFGASEECISNGIKKMSKSKTGKKIVYPSNRKSSPCSAEKALKISKSRKHTRVKYINMSQTEFDEWVIKHTITKSGRINGNVSRAIAWREENGRSEFSD